MSHNQQQQSARIGLGQCGSGPLIHLRAEKRCSPFGLVGRRVVPQAGGPVGDPEGGRAHTVHGPHHPGSRETDGQEHLYGPQATSLEMCVLYIDVLR